MTLALTKTNAAESSIFGNVDQQAIKKMNIIGTYGGIQLEEPPESLIVTEEVWFDIFIPDYNGTGQDFRERVTIACFGKLAPITCLNFVSLAVGYMKGRTYMGYKGTKVQRITRDFMIQLGDVKTKHTSGDSIFGATFQDESFALSHSRAGWVGMANFGPDTNGSQFYILLRSAKWLDGKHVIFGKVIKGMDALQKLAEEETGAANNPLRDIIVENSGIVNIAASYNLTAAQLDTDGDVDTSSI
ncbi:hypothetical protein BsWGS_00701 [Bradybaena similaris]